LFIWGRRNDFDVGYIHFEGHRKGWALKIKTFLGPLMAMSKASAIWAHLRFSGPTPSNPDMTTSCMCIAAIADVRGGGGRESPPPNSPHL